MNLKRRLNWAASIIFTLFVAMTSLVQMYGIYGQLTSKIANHNTQLAQLIEAGKTPEQVFDQLTVVHQYERFSMTVPASETFKFIAESAIDWPPIATLLEPTQLLSTQTFTINGISTTYLLDLSAMLSREQQLLISLIVGLSALYILYSMLVNSAIRHHVAQPLDQVAQALGRMSEFHFGGSEPNDVIDEVKPITRALQKTRIELEGKYKKLTSQNRLLQQEAFNDELTGYGNRVLFIKEFSVLLDPEQKAVQTGLLCFIRTTQLGKINKEQGFKAGDDYISKIAKYLHESLSRMLAAQLYRINGADFAVLLPGQDETNISLFTDEFKTHLDDYQKILDVESLAYTGIVTYRTGQSLTDILASVDTAVSIAQTLQTNGWHFHKGAETQGSQQWKDTIDEVLQSTKLTLLHQPVIPTRGEEPLYLELFARFYDKENNELATQSLIAMAQRHGHAIDIDKLIVSHITKAIQEGHLKGHVVGVKLTTSSVLSNDFLVWLERHLMSITDVARQMIFEVNCNTVEKNHDHTKQLIGVLHKCGAKFSLTNFGVTTLSFKQLKTLKPNYVKLDRSLTSDIVTDKDDQFYVKQLVDITHHLHTKVIIVGIESEVERFFIEGLRVDGMQGYFISKPTNISELTNSVYH